MLALTLHRPWPFAVSRLGKSVENRTWKPPKDLIGQRIAIHAGAKYDQGSATWIEETFGVTLPSVTLDATGIVATAKLAGWVETLPCGKRFRFSDNLTKEQAAIYLLSPWYFGPIGWCLSDVITLPSAVPCRGLQRLWGVPVDAARAVETHEAML